MKLRFLLLAIFFSGMFFSCGKYEDGGKHFYARHRLLRYWTIREYTVDGIDSLKSLDPHLLELGAVDFTSVGDGFKSTGVKSSGHFDGFGGVNRLCVFNCNYDVQFEREEKWLMLTPVSSSLERPFIDPNEWEILELTKSEVKLRMVYGKEYVIVLK